MRHEVVAVEADIELAQRQAHALDLLDALAQHLRQQVAARHDAHERQVIGSVVRFEDLMGYARQRAVDILFVHAS